MGHSGTYEQWSTDNSSDYPLVIIENSAQLNHAYGDQINLSAGSHTLKLYGQKETTGFYGSILSVIFTDNTSVSATIQSSGTAMTYQTTQTASALQSVKDALYQMQASFGR